MEDRLVYDLYNSKKHSVTEVAAMIRDGDYCASGTGLGHSEALYNAIAERFRKGELHDVTQLHEIDYGERPFFSGEFAGRYKGESFFTGAAGRAAVKNGWCDIIPSYYRDFPRIHREGIKAPVFIATVSPMDKHGYMSFGADSSVAEAIMVNAERIYLEVNPNMPRIPCGPQIHISQVTALFENDTPMRNMNHPEPDEVTTRIGQIIAEEVPNGATFQLGIGAIPDAVGLALRDKHHLGIHTEMFVDSMVDLIECGAVDNSLKPINTGKTVANFAVGSKRMYDFMDDNPSLFMQTVEYVNDPKVIAMHPNFVSINSAIEVDFLGQVAAESVGVYTVSGTGGASDFARGAYESDGGKAFVAFTSTAKNGEVSKIRSVLSEGAAVSTSKNDVDNVVTEYGIARLKYKTLSQRTKALISIAHPKFREELTFEAKKRNIII